MARAEELQNASAESFWGRFEAVMGGPDGLMTYRYLGTQADVATGGREGGMKIRRDMRYPDGSLMAAPLSIVTGNLGRYVARLQLTDKGNEDRLVATALAVYRGAGA
jgi:hypothetical protein